MFGWLFCAKKQPIDDIKADHWYTKIFESLYAISLLPEEWHSSNAKPPNSTAIQLSLKVLVEVFDTQISPLRIVPSTGEGICIVFIDNDKYADIECYNDDTILAIISNSKYREIWEVGKCDIKDSLKKIQEFIDN